MENDKTRTLRTDPVDSMKGETGSFSRRFISSGKETYHTPIRGVNLHVNLWMEGRAALPEVNMLPLEFPCDMFVQIYLTCGE